jgi:hypothetical protein
MKGTIKECKILLVCGILQRGGAYVNEKGGEEEQNFCTLEVPAAHYLVGNKFP